LAAGSQPAAIPLAKTDRSISDLESELRAVAEKAGADLVGIADMSPTYATWAAMSGKPVTAADAWPRAISIGVTMDDKIVDGIPKITPEYGGYFYGQAWPTAKRARSAISDWLKNQGFAAAAASKTLPGGGCKIAARYSGLAWIGKSCLAVTPQSGPRVAWEAVFTDAPLTPSARKPRDRECGDCQRCVDVCPAKAYTGIPFDEKDPPAKRYDTGKCSGYRGKLGNMFTIGACALCLEICPYGKRSDILLSGKPVVPVTPAAFPAPVNTLSK
jgi:epoxyqueuosine reductase QueG